MQTEFISKGWKEADWGGIVTGDGLYKGESGLVLNVLALGLIQ